MLTVNETKDNRQKLLVDILKHTRFLRDDVLNAVRTLIVTMSQARHRAQQSDQPN